jgi:hypothetical protein
MSETATEDTGATGEAGAPGADAASPTDGHEEDQTAEEQLHGVMQEQDPDELQKQLEHWRTTARRHERTARDNSAAAKKWREQEDANKSEVQKALEAQQAAEQERDALIMSQNRMLAAAAKDLSPDLIDYLGDGTSEEINERAERLSNLIEAEVTKRIAAATGQQQQNGSRSHGGRPAAQLVSGMRAGSAPADNAAMTSDQMFRRLMSGE